MPLIAVLTGTDQGLRSAMALFPRTFPWVGLSHGLIRESLGLRRSAGFQTGLERMSGLVDTLRPEDTSSRFGNRRSAKDSQMRLIQPFRDCC